jgi:DAK2 domain fusion protein YloV
VAADAALALTELETVKNLARASLQTLEANRQRIDDLNVYPVPDGDTGTNLTLTLRKVVETIEQSRSESRQALAKEVSQAALKNAKGNSGVIFSQIIRGFADVLGTNEDITPALLSRAFRAASDAAYRAVERVGPVEGTILTVIREMAEEAEGEAPHVESPARLLEVVFQRGEEALARTPELLDILHQAGVVDAGGAGLVEIVRGATLAANGKPLPTAPEVTVELGVEAIHLELSKYRYCTGFVVEGEHLDGAQLEDALAQIGDSLLVVGDESTLKVHVHTDDPGAALSLAVAWGVIDEVEIANMHAQTIAREQRLTGAPRVTSPALETGIVAIAQGEGARKLFEAEKATVVEGGQTSNPSVGEIVDAIEATPASEVIVLPNNSNLILAVEEAARQAAKTVRVVPSRSVQAGLAAIVPYLSDRSAEENERAMLDALESVVTGEVTIASRDVEMDGLSIRKGAYFGLVDGKAVVSDDDLPTVALQVIERVLEGDRGLLHIVTGEGAPPVEELLSVVRREHPLIEVDVDKGGQPHYPLLVVAE